MDRREHGEIAQTPLCLAANAPKLANLRFLSLYDNNLWSLRRISMLGKNTCPQLVELDIGKNDLSELPDEFALLANLERLWAEDNGFRAFPPPVLKFPKSGKVPQFGRSTIVIPPANQAPFEDKPP